MAPVHIPRAVASSKAGTFARGRETAWFENPLVKCPSPEEKTLFESWMSWQAMSCWLPPLPLSCPVTPAFVADPCDQ